jgi:hypothetical protein
MKRLALTLVIVFDVAFASVTATATPIHLVWSSTGSGSIAGSPFTNKEFSVHAVGDTDAVTKLDGIDELTPQLTSVSISGVGTYPFSNPTRIFAEFTTAGIELVRFGADIITVRNIPSIAAWSIKSNFGPVTSAGRFFNSQLNTPAGVLTFQTNLSATVTFSADIPEPNTIPILTAAVVGMLYWGRRLTRRENNFPATH